MFTEKRSKRTLPPKTQTLYDGFLKHVSRNLTPQEKNLLFSFYLKGYQDAFHQAQIELRSALLEANNQ
jgi:hypothetical protein